MTGKEYMMTDKKTGFEEALKKLESSAEKLRAEDIPLEEAIRCYEEGIKHYSECRDILDKADQKIETLTKQEGLS